MSTTDDRTVPLARYALRLGDDALVLAQRLGEWITRAPQLEEDVALANIALDLLGQARTLLTYAGEVEGAGRDEDDLAYLRDEREFRNCSSSSSPTATSRAPSPGSWSSRPTSYALYAALVDSSDETLAGVAAKAVKEVAYHRDHATQWVLRLGDGTDGVAPPDAGRARRPSGRTSRAVRRADDLERRWSRDGVAVDAGDAAAGVGRLVGARPRPRRR